jgi:hypothetical protein
MCSSEHVAHVWAGQKCSNVASCPTTMGCLSLTACLHSRCVGSPCGCRAGQCTGFACGTHMHVPPCAKHFAIRVLPPLCVAVCHRVCCGAQTRLAPTESNHVSRVLCFLIFQIPIPGWQQPRGGLAAIPHRSDCPAVPVPWGQLHFISPRPGAALPPLILSCVIIMRDHPLMRDHHA